jgi:hypothetical protein
MESIIEKALENYNIDKLKRMKKIIDERIIKLEGESKFNEMKKSILHIYERHKKHKHINVLNNITEFKLTKETIGDYCRNTLSYKIFNQTYELYNTAHFEDSSGGKFEMKINGLIICDDDEGFNDFCDTHFETLQKLFEVPLQYVLNVICLILNYIFDEQLYDDMYNYKSKYYPDSIEMLHGIMEDSDDE